MESQLLSAMKHLLLTFMLCTTAALGATSSHGFNGSVMLDTTIVVPGDSPQGTLGFISDDVFIQPRLNIFLDFDLNAKWSIHLLGAADRGFDPGSHPDGQVRVDEYYFKWNPRVDDRIVLRAGKFATVYGGWVPRHLAWDNPLITAPIAYSEMLPILASAAAVDEATFLGRKFKSDNPSTWSALVWGPAYSTGASISGRLGDFDYAFEVKSAALAASPSRWDAIENGGFESAPTWTGRAAWHPAPEWTLGASLSHGAWTQDDTAYQTLGGIDVSYAHGKWQWWLEMHRARFELPGLTAVHVTSGFVEGRYKIAPGLWIAARWNQSWFDEMAGQTWNDNTWRADLAVGFRLSRNVQAKIQYSLGDDSSGSLAAAAVTVRF